MLVIRLRRTGKKNKPSYRVVVAEHSYPVNGKFTSDLGFYNPHTKKVGLDLEAAKQWLDRGAQPSNTVAKILQQEKIKHNSVVIHQRHRKPKTETKADKTASPAPTVATKDDGVQNQDTSTETTPADVADAPEKAEEVPSEVPAQETE